MINLYNCDCFEFMNTIPDSSIDLIYTDPPYDVSISRGGTVNTRCKLNETLQPLKDNKIDKGYDIRKAGFEFLRIMKEPNIYIWCNKKQIIDYFNFYVNEIGCKFDILVWNKTNALPTYSNKYLSDCEYCLYFHKGKGKCFPQTYEDAKTVYQSPINRENKIYDHPTIKPLSFVSSHIKNSTRENDVVFDPFMGSGTTGVACRQLNRNFIGCEIIEKHFETAKKRCGVDGEIKLINKSGKKKLI